MLFEPIKLGSLEVPNRFVRSATNEWLAEDDGTPTTAIVEMYEELARNDVGLIITGYSYVNPRGKSNEKQQGIYADRFITPYHEITSVVHKYGSKIIAQIVHGGRQSLVRNDTVLLGPSVVKDETSGKTPVEMTEADILQTIEDFVEAARRTKEAGFDGVQLHCAHGFLLSSFISPYTNQRTDQWGGSVENRTRIIVEIVEGIQERVGSDYPIMVKMNATDGFDMYSGKIGLDAPECVEIAAILEEAGICAIEVSGGIFEAGDVMSQPDIDSEDKEAYFRRYAKMIKDTVNIPIILVGGIRSRNVMDHVLKVYADMVSMSRPFICEPDLVRKIRDGAPSVKCVSCNLCFDPEGIKCHYFSTEK
ncbi:2,4-dienoyl-CoA reductase-like NADH-dependent reductase (Old Yellow Enzyme family) [Methanohalophilus levihalophilus]|uniref:NADH:flavin oxidoreductase n=1 Tax=Methanohalophilus levihalophilus TaxID=1431282 RepID=UPI001AE8D1D0|nr:NADH:flavin oxidoreductase [Methanohalophilus levihalophilus]MBP2029160.1 2,4-dienoyl-CoA reductase-like NADH-dependent reductase (Old Yellow Enzyme family) [Methanohalophilus levihalophilus]